MRPFVNVVLPKVLASLKLTSFEINLFRCLPTTYDELYLGTSCVSIVTERAFVNKGNGFVNFTLLH